MRWLLILILIVLLPVGAAGANLTICVTEDGTSECLSNYSTLKDAIYYSRTVGAGDTLFIKIADEPWTHPDTVPYHYDWDALTVNETGCVYVYTEGAARHSGVWCDTCYILDLNGYYIDIEDRNIVLDGIQIRANSSSNDFFFFSSQIAPSYCRWINCLIDNNDRFYWPLNQAVKHEFRTCLIMDTIESTGVDSGFVFLGPLDDADSLYFANCTFVGSGPVSGDSSYSFQGHVGASCVVEIWNCLFYDWLSVEFDPFGTYDGNYDTLDYCASDTSTTYSTPAGEGSHNRVSQTFAFRDAGSMDYRLAAADTSAAGRGRDLSTGYCWPFSTDVEGTTITSWPIGFSLPSEATTAGQVIFIQ